MSSTYTATPDAIVSGGAVQITDPVGGDALTAASNNVGQDKVADVVKKLINQAVMAGLEPSVLDAHLGTGAGVQGTLLATEVSSGPSGTAIRIYSRDVYDSRDIWLTQNAKWTSATPGWTADVVGVDSFALVISGDSPSFAAGVFRFLSHDNSGATPWLDSAWEDERLTNNSADLLAGQGLIVQPAVHAIGGGGEPAFQNSWANSGSGLRDVSFWKDQLGGVHLQGHMSGGASTSVAFTLPLGYRPSAELAFPNRHMSTSQSTEVLIETNGEVKVIYTTTSNFSLEGIVFY